VRVRGWKKCPSCRECFYVAPSCATIVEVPALPGNIQVRTLDSGDHTILVVDDEAAGRDLLRTLLSSQGYQVIAAADGYACLDLIERGGVQLVLLDLMMSKMDGVEVCTHIRKDPKHMLLPVVFTTSLHDRASRIRAKEAGADDVLVKPIDGLELLVRVDRLLRVRAQTELIYAERERLARELAKVRGAAHPAGEVTLSAPIGANALESLVVDHRQQIVEMLRTTDCTTCDSLRTRLEAMLRATEDIERRLAEPSSPFPLRSSRSTL
jgi:DNA-binding response OmpR family regulator